MLLRLITSFLLLGIIFPASVFGSLVHRCEMSEQARVASSPCCQGRGHVPAADGIAQLAHHCQTAVAPVSQVATVNPKPQTDAGVQLEAGLSATPLLRPIAQVSQTSSVRTTPRARDGGIPVFLRTCTFLI